MWQIGGYIPAVTRGLNSLSRCLFVCFLHCNQLPSAAGLCCEGGGKKRTNLCAFLSEILIQDYRKVHAQEK